jgi:hypothetical protein
VRIFEKGRVLAVSLVRQNRVIVEEKAKQHLAVVRKCCACKPPSGTSPSTGRRFFDSRSRKKISEARLIAQDGRQGKA